jgi:diguanylate cyclase (GGDEF)-like protein/PAS domain S-box-containing protein
MSTPTPTAALVQTPWGGHDQHIGLDPTDAPQIQDGYFAKAIQSVLHTLPNTAAAADTLAPLQFLETAVEQARDAILICTVPTSETPPTVCYTNQSFATWTGVPRLEMEDKPLFDLPCWALTQGGHRRIHKAMIQGKAIEGNLSGQRPQGGEYIVEYQLNPILKNGACTHYIGIIRDVTARKRIEAELVHNAHHDALTGLPNRKLFRDRLEQSLRRAKRYQDGLGLLYIDLDGFKPINDSLGHDMGDLVLQVVSSRLLDVVRASDTVARVGGDEFVVLLPSCEKAIHAERVAEKIIAAITQVIVGQGKEIFITPSIGVAHFETDVPEEDELIKCADIAMYQAKSLGKCQFVRYTRDLRQAQQTQDMMAVELSSAMAMEEFKIHFRPILDTQTNSHCGAEPMLRWLHPQRGMVSPARFLPQLATLPCESAVAGWMFKSSCETAADWPSGKRLYFTAFKSQLEDPDLAETLLKDLRQTHLAPRDLVLQVRESLLTTLSQSALMQLTKLQAMGVRILISQYGSSNLSLPQMRTLPINGLKIDASLTDRLETNGQLIRGIAALSESLGLTVMADGVRSARQLSALTRLGCSRCQGAHIGHPTDTPPF